VLIRAEETRGPLREHRIERLPLPRDARDRRGFVEECPLTLRGRREPVLHREAGEEFCAPRIIGGDTAERILDETNEFLVHLSEDDAVLAGREDGLDELIVRTLVSSEARRLEQRRARAGVPCEHARTSDPQKEIDADTRAFVDEPEQ
jgi:hypothetical protein